MSDVAEQEATGLEVDVGKQTRDREMGELAKNLLLVWLHR